MWLLLLLPLWFMPVPVPPIVDRPWVLIGELPEPRPIGKRAAKRAAKRGRAHGRHRRR